MAENNVKPVEEQQELNEILRVRREKLSALQEKTLSATQYAPTGHL